MTKKFPVARVIIEADDPAITGVIELEIIKMLHSLNIECEGYMSSPGHELMLNRLRDLGLMVRVITKDTPDG